MVTACNGVGSEFLLVLSEAGRRGWTLTGGGVSFPEEQVREIAISRAGSWMVGVSK